MACGIPPEVQTRRFNNKRAESQRPREQRKPGDFSFHAIQAHSKLMLAVKYGNVIQGEPGVKVLPAGG